MNIHEYDYSSRFHFLSKAWISTARKLHSLFQRATSMLVTDAGDEMCWWQLWDVVNYTKFVIMLENIDEKLGENLSSNLSCNKKRQQVFRTERNC